MLLGLHQIDTTPLSIPLEIEAFNGEMMPFRDRERKIEHEKAYQKVRLARDRERKYGITQERFDELFAQQGRRCFICRTDSPKMNRWMLDHDHKRNIVRGILCINCNSILGHAHDNLEILERAVFYLELPMIAY